MYTIEEKEKKEYITTLNEVASHIERADLFCLLLAVASQLKVVSNSVCEDVLTAKYRGEFRRFRKQSAVEAKEDNVVYLTKREG